MAMNKSNVSGFTLVELMIIIALIAILVTLSYPSYEAFMRRVHMEEAKASIMVKARDMERLYASKRTFTDSSSPATDPVDTEYFTIDFAPGSPKADSYEIIAKPKNPRETQALYYNSIGILSRCNASTMQDCEQY
ncbi:type IV pilin protein [Eikenella sp. NML03-A-027]|nr:type IV pilin protein [Eikenella sp. NML03-A-027]